MKKLSANGFTIAELSVVIVVVAILATITIVSYAGVQNKARAASLTTTAQKIDNALRTTASKHNTELWPRDTVFTGTGNPRIDLIMKADYVPTRPEATTLRSVLGGEVVTSGVPGLAWTYDNDGDSRPVSTCDDGGQWTGVVLAVSPISARIAREVDKSIDDNNLGCGKIRHTSTTLLYQLGFDQSIK